MTARCAHQQMVVPVNLCGLCGSVVLFNRGVTECTEKHGG